MKNIDMAGCDNAAIRGYILRLLARGNRFTLFVRSISKYLISDGLVDDPNIGASLKYLFDMGLIEFPNEKVTPYAAYEQDALVRLSTQGVRFMERGGDPESGIDL